VHDDDDRHLLNIFSFLVKKKEKIFQKTLTGNFRVALESWRALAFESSGQIVTDGAPSANGSGFDAGRRRCALVDVDASHFGVAAVTGRAGAFVTAVRVGAEASGAASVAELALVDIGALRNIKMRERIE
jgi:hypothetical protein